MFHCLLSDVFSIKSYQIFLDRAFDKPGHGKGVVDGFDAVQKLYLATCLIMLSTPEVDTIDDKRLRVYSMIEKVEVRFAKECKRFLDLCDEIDTKGDKRHTKT